MSAGIGAAIADRLMRHLMSHRVSGGDRTVELDGEFSLFVGGRSADLYGHVDPVYICYTLGRLAEVSSRSSRERWAEKILACQDDLGWFTKKNLRGHSKEHATAYAIGALRLLEVEPAENYLSQVRPLREVLPLIKSRKLSDEWLSALGCHGIRDMMRKDVGWNHVWRGSHVGGGVAAAVWTLRELVPLWDHDASPMEWFSWYFDWLDAEVNPKTGMWQRALWNHIISRPTIIDLGGAVHFYWIYTAAGRPLPHPRALIDSTLALQRESGLYKNHPYCIDLDGNFCVSRPALQLGIDQHDDLGERVLRSLERNFDAVSDFLLKRDLPAAYPNLHGPPGALAALVECAKMPGFSRASELKGWRNPLDVVPWL